MRAGRRVAYVLAMAPDGRRPIESVTAWPATARLMGALAGEHGVRATVVWRTDQADATIHHRGVAHRFVRDEGRAGLRLAAAVWSLRPDVIHVNSFLYPVPTVALRLACPRTRILVQHHGEAPATGGRAALAQRAAGRVINAVAFTGADEQVVAWRRARVVRHRTTVHEVLEAAPDVDPVPRTQARATTGMSGSPAVIWVGRLIPGKDPVGAVRAFAAAYVDVPAARLWMVCTNRQHEIDVRAAVAAAGMSDRVALVGPVDHGEMGAWLSGADVFLSTSRGEGSGYALLEAMACGCTPVVSDLGPHRAIVGPVGRRFPVGDEAAAAAALRDAGQQGGDRARTSAAALARARTALSWSAVAAQLVAAYGLTALDADTGAASCI